MDFLEEQIKEMIEEVKERQASAPPAGQARSAPACLFFTSSPEIASRSHYQKSGSAILLRTLRKPDVQLLPCFPLFYQTDDHPLPTILAATTIPTLL